MKSLKLCETKKLHYGKYLYKLVLANQLNTIFRSELQKDNRLSFAKSQIEKLADSHRKGEPLIEQRYRASREIPIEDYFDATDIYHCLRSIDDYKVRVDPWRSLIIYSNDRSGLMKIANKMRVSAKEFWEPDPSVLDIIKDKSNIILVDEEPDLLYKVTLGRSRSGTTLELANWLVKNSDKSRVGPIALETFKENGYCDGLYFYIRDKKVLMLIQMMVGNKIRRVDKLVYKGNIDK
jgi:hypothetical protein